MSDILVPQQQVDVLQIMNVVNATAAPWNEYSVPLAERRRILVCSYRPAEIVPAAGVTLIEGDGTVRGFLRNLRLIAASYELANIHVHAPLVGILFLWARLTTRRLRPAKNVYTIHSSIPLYHVAYKLLLLPILAGFQNIVFCSHASAQACPKLHAWVAGKRKRVICNGVNLQRVDQKLEQVPAEQPGNRITKNLSATGSSERPLKILWIGRLIALKRAELLIDAVREMDNVHVDFVGRGPLLEKLENRVAITNLDDRVKFIGAIPRHEVYARLQAADVFVSTSIGEGMPIAVLEAMALKVPVILSDIPSHLEINDYCSSAQLTDMSSSAVPLRLALEEFQQTTESHRRELGEDCRRAVEEHFSLDAMLKNYLALYADTPGQNAEEPGEDSGVTSAQNGSTSV